MALSGDKLADLGLQPGQYDEQAHQINIQPGLEVQPGAIPGSAESRQVASQHHYADRVSLRYTTICSDTVWTGSIVYEWLQCKVPAKNS